MLTRDQLLNLTQGRDAELFERSIDLLVSRLRQRLQDGAREQTLHQDRAQRRLRLLVCGRGPEVPGRGRRTPVDDKVHRSRIHSRKAYPRGAGDWIRDAVDRHQRLIRRLSDRVASLTLSLVVEDDVPFNVMHGDNLHPIGSRQQSLLREETICVHKADAITSSRATIGEALGSPLMALQIAQHAVDISETPLADMPVTYVGHSPIRHITVHHSYVYIDQGVCLRAGKQRPGARADGARSHAVRSLAGWRRNGQKSRGRRPQGGRPGAPHRQMAVMAGTCSRSHPDRSYASVDQQQGDSAARLLLRMANPRPSVTAGSAGSHTSTAAGSSSRGSCRRRTSSSS